MNEYYHEMYSQLIVNCTHQTEHLHGELLTFKDNCFCVWLLISELFWETYKYFPLFRYVSSFCFLISLEYGQWWNWSSFMGTFLLLLFPFKKPDCFRPYEVVLDVIWQYLLPLMNLVMPYVRNVLGNTFWVECFSAVHESFLLEVLEAPVLSVYWRNLPLYKNR